MKQKLLQYLRDKQTSFTVDEINSIINIISTKLMEPESGPESGPVDKPVKKSKKVAK